MSRAPAGGRPAPRAFPFPVCPGVEPPAEYAQIPQQPELRRVVLRGKHAALLVTRHEDVRLVPTDRRFGRSAFREGPLFARTTESLALVTSDPPVHSRRRAAVAHAFTARAGAGTAPAGDRGGAAPGGGVPAGGAAGAGDRGGGHRPDRRVRW